jgi:hypothetical protein
LPAASTASLDLNGGGQLSVSGITTIDTGQMSVSSGN